MMIGCHPEGVSPKNLKILSYAQNDKHIIREIQYTGCGGIFPFCRKSTSGGPLKIGGFNRWQKVIDPK